MIIIKMNIISIYIYDITDYTCDNMLILHPVSSADIVTVRGHVEAAD